MNKYIIGGGAVVIILIILSFGISSGASTNEVSSVASAVTVSEKSYDFGEIDIFGGKVQTTYVVENTGREDITITSAQTSCMCTEGEIGGLSFGMHQSDNKYIVIPAGGEETLTAIFDPLAHGPNGTGRITRELILKTNSSINPEVKVKFTANVIKK